jgi:hypothetical protein
MFLTSNLCGPLPLGIFHDHIKFIRSPTVVLADKSRNLLTENGENEILKMSTSWLLSDKKLIWKSFYRPPGFLVKGLLKS